jgi:glycosyltransferase involved in cell wall biosynthesis
VLANGNINGIDTSSFNPENFSKEQNKILRKELALKEDDFVFIFVGRLVGDKGINELVAAFDKLTKRFQNIKLLLVGAFESDLDPLNKQTLKMINDNSAILSTGFQQDVRPYFALADVLVFPSYREGFPNVVLQAGAMGLPSIVSDINGCNEIVVDNYNGFIVPVKSSSALEIAMLKLIEDKELYNSTKANARSVITGSYERREIWQALLEEYRELLNGLMAQKK